MVRACVHVYTLYMCLSAGQKLSSGLCCVVLYCVVLCCVVLCCVVLCCAALQFLSLRSCALYMYMQICSALIHIYMCTFLVESTLYRIIIIIPALLKRFMATDLYRLIRIKLMYEN